MRVAISGVLAWIAVMSSQATAICPDTLCSASADTYLVRQSCGTLQNCFESVSKLSGASAPCEVMTQNNALAYGQVDADNCTTNGYIWGQRSPSASSPVAIDVGPGTFETFVCPRGYGHASVRGAGRDQTRFIGATVVPAGGGSTTNSTVGIDVWECDEMVVSELTAEGNVYGVRWHGAGEATWSRVDMIANKGVLGGNSTVPTGWLDFCPGAIGQELSKHTIYDSRAIVTGPAGGVVLNAFAYRSHCAETYFFGGALVNSMTGRMPVHGGLGVNVAASNSGVAGEEPSTVFMFGTEIVVQPVAVTGSSTIVGIDAAAGGKVHVEDSSAVVNVELAPSATATVIGVRTGTGGSIKRYDVAIEATGVTAMDEQHN